MCEVASCQPPQCPPAEMRWTRNSVDSVSSLSLPAPQQSLKLMWVAASQRTRMVSVIICLWLHPV